MGGVRAFSPAEIVLHHAPAGTVRPSFLPTDGERAVVQHRLWRCKNRKLYLFIYFSQDKHCSREALLAGLKVEEQQAQSPNQASSQYVQLCCSFFHASHLVRISPKASV